VVARSDQATTAPLDPQPPCTDNIQDQDETGIDCGGGACQACAVGAYTVQGTTDITLDSASNPGWQTMPQMEVTFTLDTDSVVLTQLDWNDVSAHNANEYVAVRLNVDGVPDAHGMSVWQRSSFDEDNAQNLFRIEELPAGGPYTAKVEWAAGTGQVLDLAGDSRPWWARVLSVITIPTRTGVKWAYAEGNTDACYTGARTALPNYASYTVILGMSVDLTLDEQRVVLSQFDLDFQGPNLAWTGAQLAIDGDPGPDWTHDQTYSSAGPEIEQLHLHRLDLKPAGTINVATRWGDGSDTVCNNTASDGHVGRRVGAIAIPSRVGATFSEIDPVTDLTHSAESGWSLFPGMSASLDLPRNDDYVALTQVDTNGYGATNNGDWMALTLAVDGQKSPGIHSQSSDAGEDVGIQLHRTDVLAGNQVHSFEADWGYGGGTFSMIPSRALWTHRVGMLAVPVHAE